MFDPMYICCRRYQATINRTGQKTGEHPMRPARVSTADGIRSVAERDGVMYNLYPRLADLKPDVDSTAPAAWIGVADLPTSSVSALDCAAPGERAPVGNH